MLANVGTEMKIVDVIRGAANLGEDRRWNSVPNDLESNQKFIKFNGIILEFIKN